MAEQFRAMRRALASPRGLMRELGQIVAKDCRAAFEKQRLGNIIWEKLYPGQPRPFISIAGAIEDFAGGSKQPQSKRFDDSPSLATGIRRELRDAVRSGVSGDTEATISAHHKYAASTQEGSKKGEFSTPITGEIKKAIVNWLFDKRSTLFKAKKGKEGYADKFVGLLRKDEYTQAGLARPFIGVTDDAWLAMQEAVKKYYEKVQD